MDKGERGRERRGEVADSYRFSYSLVPRPPFVPHMKGGLGTRLILLALHKAHLSPKASFLKSPLASTNVSFSLWVLKQNQVNQANCSPGHTLWGGIEITCREPGYLHLDGATHTTRSRVRSRAYVPTRDQATTALPYSNSSTSLVTKPTAQ